MNMRNFGNKIKANDNYSKWDKFDPKTFSPDAFYKKNARKTKKRNKY